MKSTINDDIKEKEKEKTQNIIRNENIISSTNTINDTYGNNKDNKSGMYNSLVLSNLEQRIKKINPINNNKSSHNNDDNNSRNNIINLSVLKQQLINMFKNEIKIK